MLTNSAADDWTLDVTLDVGAVLTTLLWAAVIVFVFWRFREPLAAFLQALPQRIRSISAAGISLELAAPETRPLLAAEGVAVDLRHAGTPNDVNDSTLRSFYRQIEDPTPLTHAVVDLGLGTEWLSSRLYILSVILRRMRGLEAFAFVETVNDERRRFLGLVESEQVRWRLAARWPRFESALAAAQLRVWGHPYDAAGRITIPGKLDPNSQPAAIDPLRQGVTIADAQGRLTDAWGPEPAAELLRWFLDAIQRPPGAQPASEEWQLLGSAPVVEEFAVWLTGSLVTDVLGSSLDPRSVRLNDWQAWSKEVRTRAVLEAEGRWVAVTRDDRIFYRLIDRHEALEQLAREVANQD